MNITPYLYVPFITWLVAQFVKFGIEVIRGNADLRYLYAAGGMPSAHSAVVCSLATYALINAGLASPIFGVTAILAAIVMYDSFGVRRSSGEQARTLNKLINELAEDGNIKKPSEYSQLREILGHQPLEVIVGAILGVTIAALFSGNKLGPLFYWVTQNLTRTEVYAIIAFSAVLILSPAAIYSFAKKQIKTNKAYKNLFKYFIGLNEVFGILFLLEAAVGWEGVQPHGQRWVVILTIIIWLVFKLIIDWRYFNIRREAKFNFSISKIRKEYWLKKAGKKK